jgi:NitT/TauT family transport system substrate-binding protein
MKAVLTGGGSEMLRLWMRRVPIVALAAALAGGPVGSAEAGQGAPEQIKFQMDWVIGGKHALFYPALEKGYYREQGLEVELLRGTGSRETVLAVDRGLVDFGFADAGTQTLEVARGAKVKVIGMVFDEQPLMFIVLKESGIKTPKDFVGKRYGTAMASMSGALFPGFMRLNQIDPSQVKTINVEIASTIPALFAGQIDITSGYSNSGLPIAWFQAGKEGKEVVSIPAGDYGLDIYSNGIIVHPQTLEKRPDTVRRFMLATYRGLKYSAEHPQEALEMVFAKHPEIRNKEIAKAQFREALRNFLTPAARKNGLGWMDPAKWKLTRDVIFEGYKVDKQIPLEEFYSPAFLPEVKLDQFPKEFLEQKVFGRY